MQILYILKINIYFIYTILKGEAIRFTVFQQIMEVTK